MIDELLKAILISPDALAESMEQYKPIIYAICNQVLSVYKDFVNNDEYYKYSALNDYKTYKAHIDAGFSEEQAFLLMIRNAETASNMLRTMSKTNKKEN